MQAVILAAGFARRMRPLSDTRHKAMLPIGGTTILARIVSSLQEIGVEVVNVVTGYRAAEVEGYLHSACPGPAYRFIRNEDYATTNNIVSLKLALDALEGNDDVLLIECDLLLSAGMLERLCGRQRGNVALLSDYGPGMDGTVVTVDRGFVTRVIPPSDQGPEFEYRDTYKTLNVYRFTYRFSTEVLRPLLHAHVTSGDAGSYYEVVLARLGNLTTHRIAAEIVDAEAWAEVDDPNDFAAARFRFEPEQRSAILDRSMGGHWSFDIVDFAFIRNVYFPTDAMLAAMRYGLKGLVSSYGSTQQVLNEKLAWFLECAPERVESLNGASQAFPILRRLWSGKTVAVPAPTFGEYAAAFPGALTYADEPGIDPDELERAPQRADVLVIVNPNNPTGTTIPSADVHALAARHPDTQFLVDESFIEFSDHRALVRELEDAPLPNILVLCSLSKTLGVPGLRIGYAYSSNAELLASIAAELPIWNMGAMAEYFVELLLKFRPQLEASLCQTRVDREYFRAALGSLSVVADVAPSGGNFVLVTLHGGRETAEAVRETLLRTEAIDVRDVTHKFHDGRPRLRLAVRWPEENERLCASLHRIGATTELLRR